ncbi:LysR substrate-binding domain-containing protein [Streptomyces sp. NPDC005476]|uniref:LysR substrate-binding domain-containing protein n=1 Tax=Streptomyces sp. NPDC005476 TaxID=3156882 RepID=UPI003456329C
MAAGCTPQASRAIGEWDATLSAVRIGLGVALVPWPARPASRTDVAIRAFSEPPPRRLVFAAVREGSEEASEIAAVLYPLREVATESVATVSADVGQRAS